MTSPTTPRPGRVLWLAAGGCALLGAVLLTPTLLPDHPAPPPKSTASAAPTTGPAASSAKDPHPAPAVPSGGSPTSPAVPADPQDGAPAVPDVPPLPADQFQGHTDVDEPAADPAAWRPVLTGFAQDFTRAGSGTSDWTARLARWTTPQLAASYADVDEREIPTGQLVEVTASDVGAFSLTFTARYETGLIVGGQAAYGPTTWRVITAEPVQPPAAG